MQESPNGSGSSTNSVPLKTERVLDGLCHDMRKAGYEGFMTSRVKDLVDELQQRGVRGIDAFVRRLSERLANREEYLDILKEGRFAKILARNGFKQIEIEYVRKGPDIKAKYNRRTVYFEITRKRENEEDFVIRQPNVAAFISPYRTENIIDTIQEKSKQLRIGELNIVVVWSDTATLGRLQIEEAIRAIQQEISCDPEKYRRISGILFTDGVDTERMKQFNLFTNDNAYKRLPSRLANKVEFMIEEDRRRLRREYDDLAAAMGRLLGNRRQRDRKGC